MGTDGDESAEKEIFDEMVSTIAAESRGRVWGQRRCVAPRGSGNVE